MNITFKSIIKNSNDDKNVIEFTAPVKKSFEHNMDIYEFVEPEHKVMNRIEVSKERVNIFAGPSSINLELDKSVANSYQTPGGLLYFNSFLDKVNIKGNISQFSYSLIQNNTKIGDFNIKITISK